MRLKVNKIFFVISIIVYISNYILTESFNIETYNTLWSTISLTALFTPLCIGCVINSIIYKKKNSAWRFMFYYFSFMSSLGLLLIVILTSIVLKNINDCLIILFIYLLMCIISIIGYFICKKIKSKNKGYFIYFSVLFILSCVIHTILILTIVI